MLIYISRVKAPPNAALQGRLTQLVEEDDGICVIGIVSGIAIGITWSGAEDAPAEMTADGISWCSWIPSLNCKNPNPHSQQ